MESQKKSLDDEDDGPDRGGSQGTAILAGRSTFFGNALSQDSVMTEPADEVASTNPDERPT